MQKLNPSKAKSHYKNGVISTKSSNFKICVLDTNTDHLVVTETDTQAGMDNQGSFEFHIAFYQDDSFETKSDVQEKSLNFRPKLGKCTENPEKLKNKKSAEIS